MNYLLAAVILAVIGITWCRLGMWFNEEATWSYGRVREITFTVLWYVWLVISIAFGILVISGEFGK